MKKILLAVVCLAVVGVIGFLAFTRNMVEQRASRLDKENLQAQERIMELENEVQALKDELAEGKARSSAPQPSGIPARPPAQSGATAPVQPTAGTGTAGAAGVSKFASAGGVGTTNLIRIEGTSSIHNWQVESHLIGGAVEFGPGFPEQLGDPKASVFIPVRSLKSLKSDGSLYSDAMDEIMYGKLLAEEHKRISYTLKTLTLKQRSASGMECEATGLLGLAGKTNSVTMPVTITTGSEGKLQFAGSLVTKMTDYGITPPAPSAGGIKITTGDEVTLKFAWWVKPVVAK